jgi:hypothetical protein
VRPGRGRGGALQPRAPADQHGRHDAGELRLLDEVSL